MGTTKDSLTTGGQYVFVAAIEGYDNLLTSGGAATTQPVTWTAITGCTATGSRLVKTAADGWGSGGATSTRSIYDGNGSVFIKFGAGARGACGLSNGDSAQSYTDIDFALVPFTETDIRVYEGGVDKTGDLGSWTAADVFEVRCTAGTVTYYQNGALLYTSATAATYPLLVDSAIYGQGDEIAHTTLRYNATSAVLTAWAATPWAAAIGGLRIAGTLEQTIDPWSTDLNPQELTLLVAPDASDTFGIACNQGGAGTESYLDTAVDANDTSVEVTDGAQFAASGSVHLGTERIVYTGNAANTLTGCTRGKYHPASRDSENTYELGRAHTLPTVDYDVAQRPVVTSADRAWIGKEVAVHMHRVAGGVLDTIAESQRIFYGTIEGIEDSEDGTTVVRLVSIEERLNRTVLFNDQWRAKVATGIRVRVDTTFDFILSAWSPVYTPYAATQYTLTAGTYTVAEIAEAIGGWLNADATVNAAADFAVNVTTDGKFRISASTISGGPSNLSKIKLRTSKFLFRCLGWDEYTGDYSGYAWEEGDASEFVSPGPVLVSVGFAGYTGTGILIGGAMGTWWNNEPWLPDEIRGGEVVSGENWGVVQISNGLFLAKYVSATELNPLYALPEQSGYMYGGQYTFVAVDGDEAIEVKQVAMISGSLLTILAGLFHSSGVTGYNSTYDVFPAQLGAAIPYDVCGPSFISSLTALGESTASGSVRLVLDGPIYLWDAISSDLLLRAAYLVWRDGGLLFTTAVTPHESVATYTWGEGDKQSTDPSDRQRTVARTSDDLMRNVLKIKYNRQALGDDSYASTLEVRFTRSIEAYGERVQTIDARNSFGDASSDAVRSLAADLVSKVMPLFGQPLKQMRRPISLEYYEGASPGSVALITDPHMRDPADGTRGVSDKPAFVLSHSRCYESGSPLGEVEVLYVDLDRLAIYSPTAEVASYADDGAEGAFTCTANAYSDAALDEDDSTHFADNDVITIVERDPSDPDAPDTLDTVVSGTPAANVINTDDQFPGYDADKEYFLLSRNYASAVATQQSDCYHADADDGRVADERPPYEYASAPFISFTGVDGTQLAERLAVMLFADGSPVATGPAYALAHNVNSLANYATAPHAPLMFQAPAQTTAESYLLIAEWPIYLGPCNYPAGLTRALSIAPLMASQSAVKKAYVRVTLSRWRSTGASATSVTFTAPYAQLEFETISTTYLTPTVQTVTPLPPLVYPQGDCWLTVEMKVEAGHGSAAYCWGISKFWLGPLA